MSGSPVDYDALARRHGGGEVVDYDALASKHGGTAQGGVLSQAGDALSHLASGLNPITMLKGARDLVNGAIADVVPAAGPLLGVDPNRQSTLQTLGIDSSATQKKILGSIRSGDYVTAARHLIGLLPMVGPQVDAMGDEAQAGHVGAALGDATAFGLVNALPGSPAMRAVGSKVVRVAPKWLRNPDPVDAAAVVQGQAEGIPVSAATATGNKFVGGVQAMADHSALGSIVAQVARRKEAEGFRRVGSQYAEQVHPDPIVPEQAGRAVPEAIEGRIQARHRQANTEYDALREIETDPANLQTVPVGKVEGKVVYKDIALPVDMRPVKRALLPIYEEIKRGMPIAEQRASRGLLAIENILNEDDFKAASVAESDLGAIKAAARGADMPELRSISQGLAAKAVSEFDKSIQTAIRGAQRTVNPGGPAAAPVEAAVAEGPAAASPAAVPRTPVAGGSADTGVRVAGSTKRYKARYEVREKADLEASHNGQTFQPNRNYSLRNDRDYTNLENQGKVVNWSSPAEFDESYHITDNPDATNGPLVIQSDGTVLGGNGRKMILDRVYASNPKGAAAYRASLEAKAGQFGIDPATVKAMKEPVLVRVVDDADLAAPGARQDAITDFNKKPTAELTPSERAIADARRVSEGTLDDLASRLQAGGTDATLAQVLEGRGGVEVLDRLIDDGVITRQERAGLAEGDVLTKAGRDRIGALTVGRFVPDAAALDRVPLSVRGKLERIAAPLAKVDAADVAWSLTPHVQSALELLDNAAAHGTRNLDDFIRQDGLFGAQKYSPEAIALAHHLQRTGPLKLTDMARQYAADAGYSEGGSLFGDSPTPASAFQDAFGALPEGEAPTLGAEASARPAEASAAPKIKIVTAPAGGDALGALRRGRAATAHKYEAGELLKSLPKSGAEGVQVFKQATWAHDAGIAHLRAIAAATPEAMPKLGRAFLAEVLGTESIEGLAKGPGMFSKWEALGPETKKLLFRDPEMISKLDNFFLLAKRAAETNPNPSGTALTAGATSSAVYAIMHPLTGVPMIIAAGALSKLLHSPAGVAALTQGLSVPVGKAAASTATALRILRLAGTDAVPAPQLAGQLPAAASNGQSRQSAPIATILIR